MTDEALRGRAWLFGDDISTDHIAPGRLFHLRTELPELAKHVLEDARPEFAAAMRPGDFVVGGRNFGLGSSREHAPRIIKLAGAGAVLAQSFARIFFRNALASLMFPLRHSLRRVHSCEKPRLFAPRLFEVAARLLPIGPLQLGAQEAPPHPPPPKPTARQA